MSSYYTNNSNNSKNSDKQTKQTNQTYFSNNNEAKKQNSTLQFSGTKPLTKKEKELLELQQKEEKIKYERLKLEEEIRIKKIYGFLLFSVLVLLLLQFSGLSSLISSGSGCCDDFSLWQFIEDFITELIDESIAVLEEAVNESIDYIEGLATETYETIKKGAEDAWEAIEKSVDDAMKKIEDAATECWKAIENIFKF